MDNVKVNVNFSFLNILLLVNIILKLVKVINWSWAVVLWPLWAEIAIVIILLLILWVIGRIYRI